MQNNFSGTIDGATRLACNNVLEQRISKFQGTSNVNRCHSGPYLMMLLFISMHNIQYERCKIIFSGTIDRATRLACNNVLEQRISKFQVSKPLTLTVSHVRSGLKIPEHGHNAIFFGGIILSFFKDL